MTRLTTIRTALIERFMTNLTGHPEFPGTTQPAELFDASGLFNVTADQAGFLRLPTVVGLQKRIDAAQGDEQAQLQRFQQILADTIAAWFGPLGGGSDPEFRRSAIMALAPVIRHPDQQAFWPADVAHLLTYSDPVLDARLYAPSGRTPIERKLAQRLFEEAPSLAYAHGPGNPFASRMPFVATIGVEGGAGGYPGAPLSAGRLNLSAADARLNPSRLPPTLYAEVKAIGATLRLNRDFTGMARLAGGFKPLQHNRLHADPLAAMNRREPMSVMDHAILTVYHAFYPADDAARRLADGTGTNREFHHLAVGLLDLNQPRFEAPRLLFVSSGPGEARVLPLNHPSLERVDDTGRPAPDGLHPVIYAGTLSPQDYSFEPNKDLFKDSAKEGLDFTPEDGEWWLGLGSAIVVGASAGASGGPIGALVGAGLGLVIFLLAWALKKLFGGSKSRQKELTELKPWPGVVTGPYTKSAQTDLGPPGATAGSGGMAPGRAYDLKIIPTFPDDNLYGLQFAGGDMCRIIDNPDHAETLAWLGFEGGIGYQFERPIPGRSDRAGSSIQNYFDLFTRKFLDLQKASAEVVYFGE
jgi:hypothetical protein